MSLRALDGQTWEISGELRFSNARALLEQARGLSAQGWPQVLDLRGVTRSDSAGLALLVELARLAQSAGRNLAFRHPPAQLARIAQVGGLQEVLMSESGFSGLKDCQD